jgi:ribosomal protein S18 acetylase RimI-like enzyme
MNIRTATIEDIPELCRLLGILFSQEPEFTPEPHLQAKGLHMILSDPEVGDFCLAEEGGNSIGMVGLLYTVSTALGSRVALLEDVIVDPAHRSVGIGGQLLDYALDLARRRGCARVTLLTDVNNTQAHRFYERHGFVKSGMIPMRFMVVSNSCPPFRSRQTPGIGTIDNFCQRLNAMNTGYEVTYRDFRQLLSDPDYRAEITPLIRKWFGCEVVPVEDSFMLRDPSGAEVSPHAVHEAIQADPDRQYTLYQKAMNLWR